MLGYRTVIKDTNSPEENPRPKSGLGLGFEVLICKYSLGPEILGLGLTMTVADEVCRGCE